MLERRSEHPFKLCSELNHHSLGPANPSQSCLRNAVSLFRVVERELEWRRNRGQLEGFDSLKVFRPTIAVGAEQPLEDQSLMADYFRASSKNS
jgi:hypothetical protein